jgi:hypothetical protein
LFRIAAFLLAVVPAFALAQAHPHLFYGPNDVARLQAQAGSTHAYIANGLRTGANDFVGSTPTPSGTINWTSGRTLSLGDLRDIGNGVAVFAFVWQIDGSDSYLQLARSWLLGVAGFSTLDLAGDRDLVLAHNLAGVAIAYDILYPKLSDGERATVRAAITNGANLLMGYGQGGGWWEREFLQNHNWINHAAVGYAGLALKGEAPDSTTDAWIAYAAQNARTVNAVTDPISDGGWHEGLGYLSYGSMFHVPFTYALARAGGDDLTDMAMLRGEVGLRAHGQIAEAPWQRVLTYGDFFEFDVGEGLMSLRFAASRYRDGVAQAVADRQVAGSSRYTYAVECMDQIFEFLFYDPSVPGADLSQLPLDWYGNDIGGVIFRSGWDKGATIFALKSAPFGGHSVWERIKAGVPEVQALNIGHDHADDNGFYLYGGGSWLAPEAEGYYIGHPDSPGPQANKTIFHNSMTIDGVGQLGEGVRPSDRATANDWYDDRAGSIPFHASSRNNAYAIADGAKLYPAALGLTRWDRHVLFLDRKWPVLRDVVQAGAAHDFHYIAHFMEGAAQEGSWIRGTAQNGQSLGVAVVSPASWSLTVTQQAPNRISGLNPHGYVYAAEVAPTSQASAVTFLTALVPTSSSAWASRPTVAPLDPSQPGTGLVLTDGSRVSSAIFSDDSTGTRSAGGLELKGLTGVAVTDGGALTRALLVQATSLTQGGAIVATQDGTSALLEADGLDGTEVRLTGDVLGGATFHAPRATKVTWFGQDVPFVREGEYVRVSEDARPDPTGSNKPSAGPAASAVAGAAGPAGGGCSAGAATADVLALLGAGLALRRRSARRAGRSDRSR